MYLLLRHNSRGFKREEKPFQRKLLSAHFGSSIELKGNSELYPFFPIDDYHVKEGANGRGIST